MTFPHAANLFSSSYATARQRFREAAGQLGCTLEAHTIGQTGPGGEDLTIDVAISPGARVDRTLVLSSGLHGVEGFFGSAVQLGLLQAWAAGDSPPVRCVMLHALNPYGFAWRRRVNEGNVDLNRNLLLAGEPYQGSPAGYAALDGLLNPARMPSQWEPVRAKVLLAIARYGLPALIQAVAGGQYDFPRGLFYGGAGPSRTCAVLTQHFQRWLAGSTRALHIDFHTGLGPWARYKLLVDYPLGPLQRERLDRCFGVGAVECTADGPSVAYRTRGSFGQWCVAQFRGCEYSYLAAEFGTCHVLRVLAGLRAENQAHHWAPPGSLALERARQALVQLFCPSDAGWRAQVVERSHQLVRSAIESLREVPASHN